VRAAFDELWLKARILDEEWVDRYADRTREAPLALPPGEVAVDAAPPPPEPHRVQTEALARLRMGRTEHGWRSALVVLATGLGKTWLAAFDYRQLHEEIGVRPRLLFLAHRQELLRQAADTYRRLLRAHQVRARVGWFVGDKGDLSADLVFASVAKLARKEHLAKLAEERFDYVVVDEVHHAAAQSYRSILRAIEPRFLLGLTATPDRADAADILGLFDDRVAYSADIGRGVEFARLVPFHYFGVKDDIDYANIPWRNKRFDPEALAEAAQTEARMETLWRAWRDHPGQRTLIFCCTIAHAEFVRAWLSTRGVRTAAVYSGEGTDDREVSIQALERGEIDALCSVDVFNEGVDVPSVDRVVMLRPTESSVVFLQQLGRGLRAAPAKPSVTALDFVGNHRVFLERLRTLLSLGGREAPGVRRVIDAKANEHVDLPGGCSVELELEARELLSRMFRVTGADEVERVYRELRVERGTRPTPGELERMGYLPSRLRARHGSWFGFVRTEGDLGDNEIAAIEEAGAFLGELETTEMTKCFKMVTLEALLEVDALRGGMPLLDLARRSHSILRRSPELFAEMADDERVDDLAAGAEKRWLSYWRRNPVEAWTSAKKERRAWFRVEGDRFVPAFNISEAVAPTLSRLIAELTDYRLAQYRARKRFGEVTADGFVCRVISNQRDPILKIPPGREKLPDGETEVWVGSSVWQFRFAKEFCNVARPAGTQRNQLPDLLRRWFGPSAGRPGTSFEVRFRASPDGLWAEAVRSAVVDLAPRRGVIAYPDLRAAAGHAVGAIEPADLHPDRVLLPVDAADDEHFAVRVAGTSMDGGNTPMRDGDWAVMTLARHAPASALENRVVLVEVPGDGFGTQYQIKRLRRREGRWLLTSDNPDGPTFEADEGMIAIARLERTITPESLGPSVGAVVPEGELATAFGLDELLPRSGRHGGHLFIFIDHKGILDEPDRVRQVVDERRPGETAFVLARRGDGTYAYLGVGRWLDDDGRWAIPDADYAIWRAWGAGRETSRRLPEGALARAQLVADALLAMPEERRWIDQPDGRRARVLGMAQRGGIRVDGGDGGFKERTVSLSDLAWVVVAVDEVREQGGVLDEARVNRLRYLDGTPKGATRWIDTGWAIAAWNGGKGHAREATGSAGVLRRVQREDGTAVDASFRVEPVGDVLSIVVESRGGARGKEGERNTEYDLGLRLLLERLRRADLRIDDVLVESRDTAALDRDQRRVELPGRPYPLEIDDAEAIRKAISSAQARIGRQPAARGSGNRTRRLRIFVEGEAKLGVDKLGVRLERG
jgi:superfamily II DNA or RNA helicase